MPVINVSSVLGDSQTSNIFSAIALSSGMVSTGNWGQTTPNNLSNFVDDDPTTVTGWGQTAGASNKGYIQIDLGQIYEHLYFECKFGFRMGDGWGGGNGGWSIDLADESGNFTPLWNLKNFAPGTTEFILYRGFWVRGQKIRLTAEDVANGPTMLRGYAFKCWSATFP